MKLLADEKKVFFLLLRPVTIKLLPVYATYLGSYCILESTKSIQVNPNDLIHYALIETLGHLGS